MHDVQEGLISLGVIQFPLKIVSFFINILIARFADPTLYGIANVSFHLFTVITLNFSKEAFRRAAIRNLSNADNIDDGIKTGVRGVAIGLLMLPVSCFILIFTLNNTFDTFQMALCLVILSISAIIDLISEILIIYLVHHHDVRTRYLSDTMGNLIRNLTILFALNSPLQTFNVILPFTLGILAQSFTSLIIMGYICGAKVYSKVLSLRSFILWPEITTERRNLVHSFFKLSFQKLLMQEGDKFLMIYFFPAQSNAWGAYVLVASLGSILARLIFAPIEDLITSTFSVVEKDVENKQNETVKEKPEFKKYHHAMRPLLILSSWFGGCAAALVPPFAQTVIFILYGMVWGSNALSGKMLGYFCMYLPFMAVNGILEAYVSSRASSKWMSQWQIRGNWLSWCVLYLAVIFLNITIGETPENLILGQIASMITRILVANSYLRHVEHKGWLQIYFGDSINEKISASAIVAILVIAAVLSRAICCFLLSEDGSLHSGVSALLLSSPDSFTHIMQIHGIQGFFRSLFQEGIISSQNTGLILLTKDIGAAVLLGLATTGASIPFLISTMRAKRRMD